MSKVTIKMPPLPEGADSWALYGSIPIYESVADNRKWYQRLLYRLLMKLHNIAEALDLWAYHTARRFAEPQSHVTGYEHFRLDADTIE